MSPQQFAESIRKKYPDAVATDGTSYADLNDEELTRRVIEKYPVYKSQVQFEPTVVGSPIEAIKDFGRGVADSFKRRTDAAADEQVRSIEGEVSPLRATLRTFGQGAGAVGDIGFEVIKLLAPKVVEDLTAKGVEKLGETEVVQSLNERYSKLKETHPEAMKDVEAVFNIGALIPAGKAAQLTTKAAANATTKAASTVSKITGDALDARRVARIDQAKQEIDSVVGTIVQGKKGDLTQAKRALSTIDTRDVKSYQDLREKIDDGVEALASRLDEHLDTAGASIGPIKRNDLITETAVGKSSVKQSFVTDAIEQLDELYQVIKDAPALARIRDLRTKLSGEGLTLRELNDLAREYGREFGRKAFSKATGDPLTSINAQAFENTRKGIKTIVRSKMPDDFAKMLDQRMGDLLNTNRLVKKMEEKVNSLYQRAKKRGVLEKAARRVADLVDVATFGTVSGFISRLLPSNVGLKVMNSIDLENALTKNVNRLEALLKITDDAKLVDEIAKFIRSNTGPR